MGGGGLDQTICHLLELSKSSGLGEGVVSFQTTSPVLVHSSSAGLLAKRFALSTLRIDNSGWSVNSSALFDVAGMRWHQRKYHVLHIIRQQIINSIY